MATEKRTAFLIIHGNGAHTPFEVGDSFVRGFYGEFSKRNPNARPTATHLVERRRDWSGKGADWVQSFVSMSVPGVSRTRRASTS